MTHDPRALSEAELDKRVGQILEWMDKHDWSSPHSGMEWATTLRKAYRAKCAEVEQAKEWCLQSSYKYADLQTLEYQAKVARDAALAEVEESEYHTAALLAQLAEARAGISKLKEDHWHRQSGHSDNPNIRRTYYSWRAMRTRCRNPRRKEYFRYGGRGIEVCLRWDSFESFVEDMGYCPEGKTIDRINNDGNYEPGNCRWATRREQRLNIPNVRFIEHGGKRQSVSDWERELGLSRGCIHYRLKSGWSEEDAVSRKATPPAEPARGAGEEE